MAILAGMVVMSNSCSEEEQVSPTGKLASGRLDCDNRQCYIDKHLEVAQSTVDSVIANCKKIYSFNQGGTLLNGATDIYSAVEVILGDDFDPTLLETMHQDLIELSDDPVSFITNLDTEPTQEAKEFLGLLIQEATTTITDQGGGDGYLEAYNMIHDEYMLYIEESEFNETDFNFISEEVGRMKGVLYSTVLFFSLQSYDEIDSHISIPLDHFETPDYNICSTTDVHPCIKAIGFIGGMIAAGIAILGTSGLASLGAGFGGFALFTSGVGTLGDCYETSQVELGAPEQWLLYI